LVTLRGGQCDADEKEGATSPERGGFIEPVILGKGGTRRDLIFIENRWRREWDREENGENSKIS